MQSLNADIEEVFDETIKTVAAEARFVEGIKKDLVALRAGTLKTYTQEELNAFFAEFERKMEEKYGHSQNLRAQKV